jgi:radical SAM-linked protein
MKAFERALRRSKLPIAYSQGFNPHPMMVFGLPLSVGVTSEAEYADFELTEDVDICAFLEKLNEQLPMDMKVINIKNRTWEGNIMASIASADYLIEVQLKQEVNILEFQQKLDEFLSKTSIIAQKEGKNTTKDIEIRPMIETIQLVTSSKDSLSDKLCYPNLVHPNRPNLRHIKISDQ